MEPEKSKERKLVVLYCNGEVTTCYEDEVFDPPEDRKNYKPYNEEESDN